MAHFWHQKYDFWSSPLKACLPPEGRILHRVCWVSKKNQNAPRPSEVILCLNCRRIALIGTCLLNLIILIGTCLMNLGILIGTCLLKPVPLTFELAGEVDGGQPMAHFWHQKYDFWPSLRKACLPPEGRILRRVCWVLKKNQNAPRPSDVILCLDCRRIVLIGTCLLNLRILFGTCLELELY